MSDKRMLRRPTIKGFKSNTNEDLNPFLNVSLINFIRISL